MKKGFTILEILVVIMLIVMVMLLFAPIIEKYISKTKSIVSATRMKSIEDAAYLYIHDNKDMLFGNDEQKATTIKIKDLIESGILQDNVLVSDGEADINENEEIVAVLYDGEITTKFNLDIKSKPLLILRGLKEISINKGEDYHEYGAFLVKFTPIIEVSELNSSLIVSNINNEEPGKYTVQYNYVGADSITRSVFVIDTESSVDSIKPVITLNGQEEVTISKGSTYNDPGATAYDNKDGNITQKIIVTSNLNTKQKGTYQIKYDVIDTSGNPAITKIRTVIVN